MGTPASPEDMAGALLDFVGGVIRTDMVARFRDVTILDVGAGWGKYRLLLPAERFQRMDCVEIWADNVEENRLDLAYDNVVVGDICDVEFDWYDVIIMGDVLEHIEPERAVPLVGRLAVRCAEMFVAVPYLYPQGEEQGNPYEAHLQSDLTPQVMADRYPTLRMLASNGRTGVYVKR